MPTIIQHPNHIVRAKLSHKLSKIDENIIFHILKEMKPYVHFEKFKKYSSEEIILSFRKLDSNRNYKPILSSIDKLRTVSIDYTKNLEENGTIERTVTNFISGYRKSDNNRNVFIEIPSYSVEYLTYLQGGYAKIDFDTFISLKSTISKCLYKLCCQYIDKGGFDRQEKNLRKELNIQNKYLNKSDFIKQLNLAS